MSSKRGRRVSIGSSREPDPHPPQDTYSELIQGPREAAAAERERQEQEQQKVATATAVEPRSVGAGAPEELTLEQIQAVPKSERRPTNFALPKVLELHRRMTYYKVDHDVQIQDQIALATDRWLREQGY